MTLVRKAAIALALTALLGVLAIFITMKPGDRTLFPAHGGEQVQVYVVYNYMHANLVVPRAALALRSGVSARALAGMGGGEWVSIGWGDASFYRERGLTPRRIGDFTRYMLKPDNPSTLLLDPMQQAPSPASTGRDVARITLSPQGFERLATQLDAAFMVEDGRPLTMGRGRSPDAWFFRSVERTDGTRVCNHWIGELLNAAGIPVSTFADTLTAGLAWDVARAGGRKLGGPRIKPHEAETPPAHSGLFAADSPASRTTTGGVRFETYAMTFAHGQRLDTAPLALAPAGPRYAKMLATPPDSLVSLRSVTRERNGDAPGLCGSTPVAVLAIGFRRSDDMRYEIVLAAFPRPDASAPCGVFAYRQL